MSDEEYKNYLAYFDENLGFAESVRGEEYLGDGDVDNDQASE